MSITNMSFIDIIAILLIICLCYIGYSKGTKGKTFFLSSFTFSSFFMYFIFDKIFLHITNAIPNLFIASILSILFVFIPIFILIEFLLRKSLMEEKAKSFSATKGNITFLSRISGALIGFIGGYIFVFTIISVTIKNAEDETFFDVPSFLEKSFFYKLANAKKKASEINIKTDNLKPLNFLYSKEVRAKYSLSEDETIVILKMIKGISNKSAKELMEMQKTSIEIQDILLKMKELYELELNEIDPKFKSDPHEIEIIFERFQAKSKLKK